MTWVEEVVEVRTPLVRQGGVGVVEKGKERVVGCGQLFRNVNMSPMP